MSGVWNPASMAARSSAEKSRVPFPSAPNKRRRPAGTFASCFWNGLRSSRSKVNSGLLLLRVQRAMGFVVGRPRVPAARARELDARERLDVDALVLVARHQQPERSALARRQRRPVELVHDQRAARQLRDGQADREARIARAEVEPGGISRAAGALE